MTDLELGAFAAADGTDQRANIQRCFDAARGAGVGVHVGPGLYGYRGVVTANGVVVHGDGDASEFRPLDAVNSAVVLTGAHAKLQGVKVTCPGGSRLANDESTAVLVRDAVDFEISRVRAVRSTSAGFFVLRSGPGKIMLNSLADTRADSIHMTGASHDIEVHDNLIERSGDDGISVVSYIRNGAVCRDILVRNNRVLQNRGGRGITVVGGERVVQRANLVVSSAGAAGCYISAESEWGTYGVRDITVDGNTFRDCGGTDHGAVMLYNSQAGTQRCENVVVINNTIDAPRGDCVRCTGAGYQEIKLGANVNLNTTHAALNNAGADTHISFLPVPIPAPPPPSPPPIPAPPPVSTSMVEVPTRDEFTLALSRIALLERAVFPAPTSLPPPPVGAPFCGVPGTPVWEITFGSAGTYKTIDALRGDFYKDWTWGTINSEWQRYTDFNPANIRLNGNELQLVATPTRGIGAGMIDSAQLISKRGIQLPAIVEFCMMMPRGMGHWPAGWLYSYTGSPNASEIDIIESVYNRRDGLRDTRMRIFQNFHGAIGASRNSKFDQWGGWLCNADTAAGFHYYTGVVGPTSTQMYFDRTMTRDTDFKWDGPDPSLIVNLACSSSAIDWPGYPEARDFQNGDNVMKVRSVRVFSLGTT